jgi:hypothetical protein
MTIRPSGRRPSRLAVLRGRLTFANLTASLALFLALGGTSYAVTQIGSRQIANNSVKSVDVKNNSLTGTDVKNGSLRAVDFAAGQLPAGPKGDTGATGPPGPQGPAGSVEGMRSLVPTARLRPKAGASSTWSSRGFRRALTASDSPAAPPGSGTTDRSSQLFMDRTAPTGSSALTSNSAHATPSVGTAFIPVTRRAPPRTAGSRSCSLDDKHGTGGRRGATRQATSAVLEISLEVRGRDSPGMGLKDQRLTLPRRARQGRP